MDINKAFTYQFQDRAWPTKLGLGALISLVPVVNFALAGYEAAIVRNVAAGKPEPLPEWDDFSSKFRDGLILTAAGLIYAAPLLIFLCLPLSALIVSGALSKTDNLKNVGQLIGGAGAVLILCFMAFLMLYALVLGFLRPAIMVLFSKHGTFASCFRFREMMDLVKRDTQTYFMTWLVMILGGMALGFVLGMANMVLNFIPCIGWIASIVITFGSTIYLVTSYAHLFGKLRRATDGPTIQPAAAELESPNP